MKSPEAVPEQRRATKRHSSPEQTFSWASGRNKSAAIAAPCELSRTLPRTRKEQHRPPPPSDAESVRQHDRARKARALKSSRIGGKNRHLRAVQSVASSLGAPVVASTCYGSEKITSRQSRSPMNFRRAVIPVRNNSQYSAHRLQTLLLCIPPRRARWPPTYSCFPRAHMYPRLLTTIPVTP